MLAEMKSTKMPKSQGVGDDARILSLAEAVGNMGHWYWHIRSGVLSWSEQVFHIFGRDPESFNPTYDAFINAVHPDDRQRVQTLMDQARKGGAFEFDARFSTPAGAVRNLITKGQPESDDTGEIVAIFGVVTDITEAFNTLQAVRDQKEMLDLAARVSGLGHWVWDPDKERLAYCSDQLADLFNQDVGQLMDLVGHPADFAPFLHEADRPAYTRALEGAISKAEPYDLEYRVPLASGSRHYREIGQPLVDSDGQLQRFIATVQDITESKAREADLEKARRELELLVEAKDQLFSIIGHDLKSPFSNIIGFASLLSQPQVAASPDKVQEYAALIVQAAENTNALLDTLLAWAAAESEDLPFRPVQLALADAFDDSVKPLAVLAKEKDVAIQTHLDGLTVKADRDMVLTVFRNLINNAIKFCQAGDTISVSAQPKEDRPAYVHVTVADTGVGMDPAKVAAFVEGQRLETSAGTDGETGSGLGLRMCHNLISRHGGTLTVESTKGRGCTVHFTLPATV